MYIRDEFECIYSSIREYFWCLKFELTPRKNILFSQTYTPVKKLSPLLKLWLEKLICIFLRLFRADMKNKPEIKNYHEENN